MSDTERRADAAGDAAPEGVPPEPGLDQLIERLEELEELVDDPRERQQVRETMHVARRIPGLDSVENGIRKYTARDIGEAFVGSILLALPMLVEDGVFEIARHFASVTVAGVPVFLVSNVSFVLVLTIGIIYWTDIRKVAVTRPLFGVIPRRLAGVLSISLLTATGLLLMWGRLFVADPTPLEVVGRISVVWAAGAFGAALGDILPGESEGYDVTIENIDDIVRADG